MPVPTAVRRRVRVEMQPEDGKAVRGAGSPGGEGADAAGSVIAAESAPCEVLQGRSMLGDSRRGSGDFCRACTALRRHGKNRSESDVDGRKNDPQPGRQSIVTAADTRTMNIPEGAERSPVLIRCPRARKPQKNEEAKWSPHRPRSWGGAPAHPSQHRGSVRNECEACTPRWGRYRRNSRG